MEASRLETSKASTFVQSILSMILQLVLVGSSACKEPGKRTMSSMMVISKNFIKVLCHVCNCVNEATAVLAKENNIQKATKYGHQVSAHMTHENYRQERRYTRLK